MKNQKCRCCLTKKQNEGNTDAVKNRKGYRTATGEYSSYVLLTYYLQ